MQIAVTGSTGRIGRAIVEMALAQGHGVVGLDRLRPDAATSAHPNFSFAQLEMTEYHGVETALRGCDALIHMAAIAAPGYHPDPWVHNGNVVGSYNALRAAAEVGIRRICQASSVNAIGVAYSRRPRYDYFPVDEDHPTYTEDPYSLSKWICELQAEFVREAVRGHDHRQPALSRRHRQPRRCGGEHDDAGGRKFQATKALWGWVSFDACARASLAVLTGRLHWPRGVLHRRARHHDGSAVARAGRGALPGSARARRPERPQRIFQIAPKRSACWAGNTTPAAAFTPPLPPLQPNPKEPDPCVSNPPAKI